MSLCSSEWNASTQAPRACGVVHADRRHSTDVWRALTTPAQESKLPLHVLPLLGDLHLDEVTAAGPSRSLPDLVRPSFSHDAPTRVHRAGLEVDVTPP